jgi:sugar lactone lactonase YvrE
VLRSDVYFPNGLAVRKKYLYVASTLSSEIVRLPFTTPGSLGDPETYATGVGFADGIAFDRPGNLFVVGQDRLWVIDPVTQAVQMISHDPLLDYPSNIAFGRSAAFDRETMYLANFGLPLGSGTTLVRVATNHRGATLIR